MSLLRAPSQIKNWPYPSITDMVSPFSRDLSVSSLFGNTSKLMRRLERELDMIRDSFEMPRLGNEVNLRQLELTSPITIDKDGNRHFEVAFDLTGFDPEEVKVQTENGKLILHAKKETSTKDDYSLNEFSQTYTLPSDLKRENLKTKWTDQNVLVIEAELPKLQESENKPKLKEIQIEHK